VSGLLRQPGGFDGRSAVHVRTNHGDLPLPDGVDGAGVGLHDSPARATPSPATSKIENLHKVGKPPPWLQTDKPWDNPEITGKPVPVTVRIPPLDPLAHGAAYFNAIRRSPLHGKLLDGLRGYYR
jgi:hypothetical protein